ncbi:MAG: hypothetical protein P8X74_04750 [Reinekea sp.]|jgi:hypothetical protein
MKLSERLPLLLNMARLHWVDFKKLHKPTRNDADVLVSLTSIPSRLGIVHYTVMSLLLQSRPPARIILWLHDDLRDNIPEALAELCGARFEIRYSALDSRTPHRKLVPSLLTFPDKTIVTCDDDQYYSRHWLKCLVDCAQANPGAIVAQRYRKMSFDTQGEVKPYRDWKYDRAVQACSAEHLAVGFGGVLYPSHSLHEDVLKSDIYLSCCPRADDLWFKAMAYLNGTRYIATPVRRPHYELMDSQVVSLKAENVREDGNRSQWIQLCERYPELKKIGH